MIQINKEKMRVPIFSFLLNFFKSFFDLTFLRERYRRFYFVKELRSIVEKKPSNKQSLRSRIILWYSGSKGLKYYLIRSPFQLARFFIRLPPKLALRSLLFLQIILYSLSIVPRGIVTLFTYVYNIVTFFFIVLIFLWVLVTTILVWVSLIL